MTTNRHDVAWVAHGNGDGQTVYHMDKKDDRYNFGYSVARAGGNRAVLAEKFKDQPDDLVEILMGYDDAQGDDYIAVAHPPKPPLDLSNNEKITDFGTRTDRSILYEHGEALKLNYLARLKLHKRPNLRNEWQKKGRKFWR